MELGVKSQELGIIYSPSSPSSISSLQKDGIKVMSDRAMFCYNAYRRGRLKTH